MTELSPGAVAVLDAASNHWPGGSNHPSKRACIAAALRAVAEKVVPQEPPPSGGMRPGGTGALTLDEAQQFQRSSTRRQILAIADELEGQGDG